MKTLSILSLMSIPAMAAVSSLPPAPGGTAWVLVTSGQTDVAIVNVDAVEDSLEMSLGLNSSGNTPLAVTGPGSATVDLTAFGSANPASYAVGDKVDLVTANTYTASLEVSTSGAIQNLGAANLLVDSKVSGVQVSSSLGASPSNSDLTSTTNNATFFGITPNPSAISTVGGAIGLTEGETVTFTFAAESGLDVNSFGAASVDYIINPTVNASLTRDTTFDTYCLVAVPEPSSIALVALSALGLMRRRRA